MKPKIALVGVPVETVPIQDEMIYKHANIPGVTNHTRELILKKAEERGIIIHDLGELCAGDYYKPEYNIDRLRGISLFMWNVVHAIEMEALLKSRKYILGKSKEFDLTVAVGPSHLGAIVLYEEGDVVARLDYHSDFTGTIEDGFNFASYMDWVRLNLKKIDVTNFFVKYRNRGSSVFGRESGNGKVPAGTNHFDIDVDCFNLDFRIQRVYLHNHGASEATPEMVVEMVRQAKPSKLGIWEYRHYYDSQANNGIEFIVNAIEAAITKSQLLKKA